MLKAYKYRLYPNNSQRELMHKHFGCSRFVYNLALEYKSMLYDGWKARVSAFDMSKELTLLKKEDGMEFLSEVSADSLIESIRHLDTAYKNFFNGGGYPKRKNKFSHQSFYVRGKRVAKGVSKPNIKIDWNRKRLSFPKFKDVKFDAHRIFTGEIQASCTVSKSTDGKYYISILVNDMLTQPEQKPIVPETTIGIDLGVKLLYADSDAVILEGLNNLLLPLEKKKAKLQKQISRKCGSKKGEPKSNRYINCLNKIRRVDAKIVRIRNNYLHNASRELVDRDGVSAYIIEDLKIKNMTSSAKGDMANPGKNVKQKAGLNRAITRQGLRRFRTQLEYKANWRGKQVISVDPRYTSQTCPSCGHKSKENRKKQAIFECVSCGHIDNADVNAAINIKDKFFKKLEAEREVQPLG